MHKGSNIQVGTWPQAVLGLVKKGIVAPVQRFRVSLPGNS